MENIINLETFNKGALAEKVNEELQRVIDNIYDPNTDATKVRKITLTIAFKPTKKRDFATVSSSIKSVLSPTMPTETNILIDRDGSGKIVAAEIGNQIVGQQEMDIPNEKPKDSNIIDLQKANNK